MNYDTNMIRLSFNLKAEDVKLYIRSTHTLSKYGLFDQSTFKISPSEDHPYQSVFEHSIVSQSQGQVSFPRACSNPLFQNKNLFSARSSLLAPTETPNPWMIIPQGPRSLTLLIRLGPNTLLEETVEEVDGGGPEGRLTIRGEEYFQLEGIRVGFIDRLTEILRILQNDSGWTSDAEAGTPQTAVSGSEMKYCVGLAALKPGWGVFASSINGVIFREYFQLCPGFLTFHLKDFYHIQELVGWTRQNISNEKYRACAQEVVDPQVTSPSITSPTQDHSELGGEAERGTDSSEAWFLGKRMPRREDRGGHRGGRGGGRGGREEENHLGSGDMNFRVAKGGSTGQTKTIDKVESEAESWGRKDETNWKSKAVADSIPDDWGKKSSMTSSNLNTSGWGKAAKGNDEDSSGWTKKE